MLVKDQRIWVIWLETMYDYCTLKVKWHGECFWIFIWDSKAASLPTIILM